MKALWSVFGLVAATSIYLGCTQDFGQFDPTGGAGGSGGNPSASSTGTAGGGNGGGMPCDRPIDCGDAPDCQSYACTDKMCTLVAANSGDPCTGGFCTSAGKCVDCVTADNCPDPGSVCLAKACSAANKCVPTPANQDKSCGDDPLKCDNGVCKGCTVDGMHPAPGGNCPAPVDCQTVTCTSKGECMKGNTDPDVACTTGGGKFCDGMGACKECGTKASECGTDNECRTFACTNNACSHNDKSDTTTCTTGGNICDGNGTCVECNTKMQCPSNANETCTAGHTCACTPDSCASLGLTCGKTSVGNDGCGGMVPKCDNTVKDGSETDVDCGGPTAKCPTRCAQGDKCSTNTDCVNTANNCTDGVCCAVANCGTCTSCAVSGMEGTCQPIPKDGQDNGACDDTHGCGAGKACACDGGSMCKLKNGSDCTMDTQCAGGHCTSMKCADM